MTAKIFRSIFITSCAVLLACFAIIFAVCYQSYDGLVIEELRRECEYVKGGIEKYGDAYLMELDVDGSRLTLIDEDGEILYDSLLGDELDGADNHKGREEVREAVESGEGVAVRYSGTFGSMTAYFALLLSDGRVIRVAAEYNSVFTALLNVMGPTLLLFLAVTLTALLIARKLSRSIVKPLCELDLEHPERTRVYEELRPIISKLTEQNYTISKQMDELSLKRNEFDSITSNMSEGMIVINSRTNVLSCNRSAKDILEIGDELPKSILTIKDTPAFRSAIHKALSGTNGYDSIRTEDKYYSILVTPVFHEGIVEGAVIVILDDTEKEHREELRREFTSNISHELKTPLTSISGFAELIGNGIADGEDAKRFAVRIQREAKRLITLVGDIIRLTQVDGGEVPYDEGEISLFDVCRDVIDRLIPISEKEGVSLLLDGSDAAVRGNRQILEEMIYNLVDNGIKYNNEGGYVKVSVGRDSTGAFVTVSDNGIGIPKVQQDRVFERFYRVDKSHSKEIGGTGLGLSIVKHAAAYHRASLELSSDEGVGTEIRITFLDK